MAMMAPVGRPSHTRRPWASKKQRRLREREASAWRRDAGDTAMAGGALAEAEGVADAAR
jgi:hypothetical protein